MSLHNVFDIEECPDTFSSFQSQKYLYQGLPLSYGIYQLKGEKWIEIGWKNNNGYDWA